MMSVEVFVLIFIVAVVPSSASSAIVRCEKIENSGPLGSSLKTCNMRSTVIDSEDFMITSDRDESVQAFWASSNRKLEHLPKNLGEKFPNLIDFDASACSIKEVSKQNFKGLDRLRELYLNDNQIEKIDDDTFEFIPAVEGIWLTGNKIKKLNGRAFASLHKLTWVDLGDNVCINEDFKTAARIAEMPRALNENCGFIGFEPFVMKIAKLEAELKAKSEEMQALQLENSKIEAKAELQIAHHNEIKAQLLNIELKLQEISNFPSHLQAVINEKNEEIMQLQKKIHELSG